MKKVVKFISVAMFSGLLMVASVFAAKGGNELGQAKAAEDSVRQQLTKVLSDAADNNTGLVFVYFNVTPDKVFELLNVKGENFDLAKNVEKTLKRSFINVSEVSEGKYFVKIYFVEK